MPAKHLPYSLFGEPQSKGFGVQFTGASLTERLLLMGLIYQATMDGSWSGVQ
jgi:hypothetical protein